MSDSITLNCFKSFVFIIILATALRLFIIAMIIQQFKKLMSHNILDCRCNQFKQCISTCFIVWWSQLQLHCTLSVFEMFHLVEQMQSLCRDDVNICDAFSIFFSSLLSLTSVILRYCDAVTSWIRCSES